MAKKALLTDAFGILVDSLSFQCNIFYQFAEDKFGLSEDDVKDTYKKYRHRSFVEQNYDYEDAMRDIFQELNMGDYYQSFIEQNQGAKGDVTVKEGVVKTLEELKKRNIPVYVVTDFSAPTSEARRIFTNVGLMHLIDGIISSKDVGHMKPDDEIFDHALQEYGLKKEDTYFLGHAHDEVHGAHEYGLNSVVCFPDEGKDFSFLPNERRLESLEELPDLIKVKTV
ncbi:HAD family hydrolase [Thermoproteota archaeon]